MPPRNHRYTAHKMYPDMTVSAEAEWCGGAGERLAALSLLSHAPGKGFTLYLSAAPGNAPAKA